jgi:hypothetical protein
MKNRPDRIIDTSLSRTSASVRPVASPVARAARVALPLAAVLILSSCPWNTEETSFGDYDGVNLIASRGFGASDTATGAPWSLTPGLTAATNDDGPGGAGVDYARWELTAGTGAYAPPAEAAGEPVYRLEVVNLFRNGDFEDTAFFNNQWTDAENRATIDTTTGFEGDQSLAIATEALTDRIEVDLADETYGLIDGFMEDTLYAFHIDFRIAGTTFTMGLHDGTTNSVSGPWTIVRGSPSETTVFSFPGPGAANPAAGPSSNAFYRQSGKTWFSFGGVDADGQRIISGTFDRLRVVHADRGHYIRLPVPYRSAGRPDIRSGGTYTFSVWVSPDPSATDGTVQNRFPARLLSAGIQRNPPLGAVEGEDTVVRTINDWELVEYSFSGSGINLDSVDSSDIVLVLLLEIGASHRGTTHTDSGSLLLAAPSLTWAP